jgi:hypothetical protein
MSATLAYLLPDPSDQGARDRLLNKLYQHTNAADAEAEALRAQDNFGLASVRERDAAALRRLSSEVISTCSPTTANTAPHGGENPS